MSRYFLFMGKKKKRGPGRPWDGVPRVPLRKARSVRFPPDEDTGLVKAAEKVDESVEGFIKVAVKERVEKILK